MLLAHGANVEKTSRSGWKPIVFAMILGRTQVVRYLLEADCSFGLDGIESNILGFAIKLVRNPAYWEPPIPTIRGGYIEVFKIIIKELARRQGFIKVSPADVPNPISSSGSLFDRRGTLGSDSWKTESPDQSSRRTATDSCAILPGMYTVYHCDDLTIQIAKELWSSGFREIDVPDTNGKTPLMMIKLGLQYTGISQFIKLAFWFHQKGASLHRPCPVTALADFSNTQMAPTLSERRVTHLLAARLNVTSFPPVYVWPSGVSRSKLSRLLSTIHDLGLECRQFLHQILLDDSPDDCLCACSEHGCMPVTCFLKFDGSIGLWGKWPAHIWIWFIESLMSDKISAVIDRGIVRLITFENLGLRHTCCCFHPYDRDFSTMEPEEIDERRDEDRKGIQLLESLLIEFHEKRGDQNIQSFINGYWTARMKEVLAVRDKEPVDKAAIRELGVILQR